MAVQSECHLLQHGADKVRGLKQLQVDVHVERHLPPPLQLFLLWGLVLVPKQQLPRKTKAQRLLQNPYEVCHRRWYTLPHVVVCWVLKQGVCI